jgi:hypothetical protein
VAVVVEVVVVVVIVVVVVVVVGVGVVVVVIVVVVVVVVVVQKHETWSSDGPLILLTTLSGRGHRNYNFELDRAQYELITINGKENL